MGRLWVHIMWAQPCGCMRDGGMQPCGAFVVSRCALPDALQAHVQHVMQHVVRVKAPRGVLFSAVCRDLEGCMGWEQLGI